MIAAFGDEYESNKHTMMGSRSHFCLVRTDGGGHPSKAFVDAYRDHRYGSYLFVQDSMEGISPDVVAPFREHGADVVAWCRFPITFDGPGQEAWVRNQYPDAPTPAWGIFGPVFYATRRAMERAERWFPQTPADRLQAQGTERAWAFCFQAAGVEVGALHDRDPRGAGEPLPPFTKTFANRP